jgi:hypothetical protein
MGKGMAPAKQRLRQHLIGLTGDCNGFSFALFLEIISCVKCNNNMNKLHGKREGL